MKLIVFLWYNYLGDSMDLKRDRFIILELIPTSTDSVKGQIIQLSALKLNGMKLESRFDYRLNEELIPYKAFIELIDYDKEMFKYLDNKEAIINAFKDWIEDIPLLIMDNTYTNNYLTGIDNKKESIFNYLNIDNTDDVIEKLMDKYHIEPTNHVVDILYEALIQEIL